MPKAVQLQIPEPCHENWQQMTPNEQGRHCMSCQKTVVDFSIMSDKEILNYISTASSSVCGRFDNGQLNKHIPVENNNKKRRVSLIYLWNLLIATFLVTGKGYAQGKPVIQTEAIPHKKPVPMVGAVVLMSEDQLCVISPSSIRGHVFDINKNPIAGASIIIVGSKNGMVTGLTGNFAMNWPKKNKYKQIEVSAVGYETQVVNINELNWNNLEIFLKPTADVLDSVEVISYGTVGKLSVTTVCTTTAGMMVMDYEQTRLEKIKDALTDWIPGIKKDMLVFPNPVIKGSSVNVKLNLKETGEYKMEVLDASGRVLSVQPVVVSAKDQTIPVPTNTAWSTGVYWLRLTGKNFKNVAQSKVLIQ
jgi:CarboxypepD_reg-like domain/Secretion system C-terminal sorting domain